MTIVVELKNGIEIEGTLDYVDDNLNFNLTNINIKNEKRFPQLTNMKTMFVRGSTIRYIQVPPQEVDTELLNDACVEEIN